MNYAEPTLSACIVLYKSGPVAVQAVRCFQESDVPLELFLVDNSPEEDIKHRLRWQCPPMHYISSPTNIGYGPANNLVLSQLRSTYHVICNPDVTFKSDLLGKMVRYMEMNPDCVILSPRMLNKDGTEQFLPRRAPTVRYLLGALAGFDEAERVALEDMPPLERFILHRLWELDAQVREAYGTYRFQDVWRPIAEFCSNDLSALYFDIRRDVLYCDRPDALRRRAARTVMDLVFERITAWLAPLAIFTMEEAWTTRFPDRGSNCLRTIPETPAAWRDEAEAERWAKVERVVGVVTGALEIERREKRIGSALEAAPVVHVADAGLLAAFDGLDAAEVFRTSQASLVAGEGPADAFRLAEVAGVAVEPRQAEGRKCARSWRVLPEVGSDPRYPDLSLRDADAVAFWDARRGGDVHA